MHGDQGDLRKTVTRDWQKWDGTRTLPVRQAIVRRRPEITTLVKGQVWNILSKLGAKDRTHAAMIGLKRGIIEF